MRRIITKNKNVYYDALRYQRLDAPPPGALRVGDGAAGTCLVGPAFFDPQVNGYGGVDFQDDNVTAEALEHAVAALRRDGCAHILATLITDAPDAIRDRLRRLGSLLEQNARLREAILGFHLEGPFISSDPAYAGAHPAGMTRDPEWALLARWQRASGGRIRMLTLAPERAGAVEFIRRAARGGLWVGLGHTDATSEQIRAAAGAGARIFTHLGNGCPTLLARHDNIIMRALAAHEMLVSVIPDGIHVPPPALGEWLRLIGPGRLILTTDAAAPAGAPPGRYRLGALDVTAVPGQGIRNPLGNGLAGSNLRPIEGFYNATRFGGLGADAAWEAWTRLRRQMFPEIAPPALVVPFAGAE